MVFTPATDYTKQCFNRYGLKDYSAITELTMKEPTYVSYDLTVLDFNGHYQAAHGSVINELKFETIQQAEEWLRGWYAGNKQKASLRTVQ